MNKKKVIKTTHFPLSGTLHFLCTHIYHYNTWQRYAFHMFSTVRLHTA